MAYAPVPESTLSCFCCKRLMTPGLSKKYSSLIPLPKPLAVSKNINQLPL